MSAWIEWNGGQIPVGDNDLVDVMLRNGEEWLKSAAGGVIWSHVVSPHDIIAYRICEEQQAKEEAQKSTGTQVDGSNDQALRYNDWKPQLSYLLDAPYANAAKAAVKAYGANKYARDNWKKGLPKLEVIDSLLRHLQAYQNGERFDQESGLPHVGHILCNAEFLAEFEMRGDYDN